MYTAGKVITSNDGYRIMHLIMEITSIQTKIPHYVPSIKVIRQSIESAVRNNFIFHSQQLSFNFNKFAGSRRAWKTSAPTRDKRMIIWEPVCDGPWNWIEEFLDCSSLYARRTNKNQLSVCWKVAKLSGWFVRRAHQRLARSNFTLDGVCDASPTSIQRRSNKQQVYGARVKGRQTGAARNFCEKTRSRVFVFARAR